MMSGATFVVIAEAERQGSFEVEYHENEIAAWAWPTASVRVFHDGEENGIAAGMRRPAVPHVPEGQSVSSFLGSVLGTRNRDKH